MMTRKNFRELADALRETHASAETVKAVADACKASNSQFQYGTFYAACAPTCPRCNEHIIAHGMVSIYDQQTPLCVRCGRDELAFELRYPTVDIPPLDRRIHLHGEWEVA
jgi:hypothetical protein